MLAVLISYQLSPGLSKSENIGNQQQHCKEFAVSFESEQNQYHVVIVLCFLTVKPSLNNRLFVRRAAESAGQVGMRCTHGRAIVMENKRGGTATAAGRRQLFPSPSNDRPASA